MGFGNVVKEEDMLSGFFINFGLCTPVFIHSSEARTNSGTLPVTKNFKPKILSITPLKQFSSQENKIDTRRCVVIYKNNISDD
jgi:hypothetical protein